MALINLSYFSRILGKKKSLVVEYPFIDNENINDANILLFLHGLSDNHNDLLENYGIKSIAQKNNLIIICASCDRSWYTNMLHGYKYYDYISNEVLGDVSSMLNIDINNRKVIVAGISMGGYGALKLAIKNPGIFSGVIAVSPAVDVQNYIDEFCEDKKEMYNIFGESVSIEESVMQNAKKLLPPTYICCGKDDFLIKQNQSFVTKLSNDYKYVEDDGNHDWDYFLPHLVEGIEYINNKVNKNR